MESLLKEMFPQFEQVEKEALVTLDNLDSVILLYPDSIGLGWGDLEKEIRKKCSTVEVLNGRRRHFILQKKTLLELRFKRFLEVTFLPELLMVPVIIGCAILLSINNSFWSNKKR